METTLGTLVGGRVRYAQPVDGYRTGIEPVLLAASVPARAGQSVIEAGTGAGAGLMCLAARVAGIAGLGVEIDPAMADLARANVSENALGGLSILTGDITSLALPPADHAMANPPWHDPGSTASPVRRRRLATQEGSAGVEAWVDALAAALRQGGSLTLIVSPGLVARSMAAFERAGLGGLTRLELLPKAGRPAKIVLMQAWRHVAEPGHASAMALHESDGAFVPAIDAVLRQGAALVWNAPDAPAAQGGENSRLPGP